MGDVVSWTDIFHRSTFCFMLGVVFPTRLARWLTSAAATAIQNYLMKALQIARRSANAAFPLPFRCWLVIGTPGKKG
jgi:hypothetical protein